MRPKSVTVICWIMIITGGFSFVTSVLNRNNPLVQEMMAKSPVPINLQYIIMFLGLFVTLICGVAMLKQQNWARLLYVGWGVVGMIFGLVTSPYRVALIPSLIIFFVIVFFLFRPKAKVYFNPPQGA